MAEQELVNHVSYEDVVEKMTGGGEQGFEQAVVRLDEGESAWNPASTKNVLYGPATITYVRFPDGGVTASVLVHSRGAVE